MNLRHPDKNKAIYFVINGIPLAVPMKWLKIEKMTTGATVTPNNHPLYMPVVKTCKTTYTITLAIPFLYKDDPLLSKEDNDAKRDLRYIEMNEHLTVARRIKVLLKAIASSMATERYDTEPRGKNPVTRVVLNTEEMLKKIDSMDISNPTVRAFREQVERERAIEKNPNLKFGGSEAETVDSKDKVETKDSEVLSIGRVVVPLFGAEGELPGFASLMCGYYGKSIAMIGGYLESFESTYDANTMTDSWTIKFVDQNLTQLRRANKAQITEATARATTGGSGGTPSR